MKNDYYMALFGIPLFILVLTCIWLFFDSRKYKRTHDNEVKKILDDRRYKEVIEYAISHMSGYEFEDFMENIFKWNGYKVKKTPRSKDFGKDLILKTTEGTCYVECKCYNPKNKISSEQINKLIGSAISDGVKKSIFITTSSYTNDALTVVEKTNSNKNDMTIENWYTDDVLRLCLNIDKQWVLDYIGYRM